jgi:RNA polymerase sigma factor (sigma-70 family)
VSVRAAILNTADAALVCALRRDDPDAGAQLLERYGDSIYILAMRATGSSDDAETVTRDTLWAVARDIERLTGESTFLSWIHRIAADTAYQLLETRETGVEGITLDSVLPAFDADGRHRGPVDDWSKRLDDATVRGAAQRALTAGIDALSAADRMAFVLHDVEGVANAEIAATLGTSPRDVKARVHRVRLFLRQRLSEHLESA